MRFVGSNKNETVPNDLLNDIDPVQINKGMHQKICNICYILKPVAEFSPNQTDKKGQVIRRPSCNDCRKGIDSKPIKKRVRESWEEEHGKPEPGDLFTCPICEKISIVYKPTDVVLDHHHRTGIPRGYICGSCNTGLGRFKNGHYFLDKAIGYLDKRHMKQKKRLVG